MPVQFLIFDLSDHEDLPELPRSSVPPTLAPEDDDDDGDPYVRALAPFSPASSADRKGAVAVVLLTAHSLSSIPLMLYER